MNNEHKIIPEGRVFKSSLRAKEWPFDTVLAPVKDPFLWNELEQLREECGIVEAGYKDGIDHSAIKSIYSLFTLRGKVQKGFICDSWHSFFVSAIYNRQLRKPSAGGERYGKSAKVVLLTNSDAIFHFEIDSYCTGSLMMMALLANRRTLENIEAAYDEDDFDDELCPNMTVWSDKEKSEPDSGVFDVGFFSSMDTFDQYIRYYTSRKAFLSYSIELPQGECSGEVCSKNVESVLSDIRDRFF